MVRTAALAVTLAAVIAAAAGLKCCPPGQVLTSNLTCGLGLSHLLLSEDIRPLNCSADLTLVPATRDNSVDCVDVLVDKRGSSLRGVVCKGPTDKETVPRVNFVRKCCPPERRYKDFREGCWEKDVPDDSRSVDLLKAMFLNDTVSAVELIIGVPKCSKGSVVRDYFLHHRHVWRQESESVMLKHQLSSDILLSPDEFCVDLVTDDDYTVVVRACQDARVVCGPDKLACINKCCPEGSSYRGLSCVSSKIPFDVQFYSLDSPNQTVTPLASSVGVAFGDSFRCENKKYPLVPENVSTDAFFVTDTGRLFLPGFPPDYRLVDTNVYCMEWFWNRIRPFMCFPATRTSMETEETAYFRVIAYGLGVSSVFLFITLIVYLWIPSLHNLHGKTLMCHVASLLAAYAALVYGQLFSNRNPPIYCQAIGKLNILVIICLLQTIYDKSKIFRGLMIHCNLLQE